MSASATCRFILRLLRHRNSDLKRAGRLLLSQDMFTLSLMHNGAWDLLHNGTKALLDHIGIELREFYENENLRKHLGSLNPRQITGHTHRQDFSLVHPPGCDWKEHIQEEAYIHFLRLIAFAIDEAFQRAVEQCVAPFNCDQGKKPFAHPGIKSIKGFTRMCNKMFADHRYAKKPRPGQSCQ